MAVQYYVNIKVSIGTSFNQEFYLTNPDRSPMDITGATIHANIAKHPTSLDATLTTSTNVHYKFVPFSTRVVDGKNGVFALSLTADDTYRLKEGKYVYNAVLEDSNGDKIDTVSGLVFVEVAFGAMDNNMIFTEGVL